MNKYLQLYITCYRSLLVEDLVYTLSMDLFALDSARYLKSVDVDSCEPCDWFFFVMNMNAQAVCFIAYFGEE